jgi:uncharacterized protein (TIGR02996 family)
MNPADDLLRAILLAPEDAERRLVYADWLEEQGDPASLARAELLRLQVEYDRLGEGDPQRLPLHGRAQDLLTAHPGLVGSLERAIGEGLTLLETGPALVPFLGAARASADEASMPAGSVWAGLLGQDSYRFPTTFRVTRRQGNVLWARMTQDFASRYGVTMLGHFNLSGVLLLGRWLAFVSTGGTGPILYPGLYQGELRHAGWLIGTWLVPQRAQGTFQLRRRHEEV